VVNNFSFFLEDDGGSLVLKEDHMYYYQIQLQCHMQYCDFIPWREDGELFHQTVELDSDYAICDVEPFIILPELVPVMPLQSSTASNGAVPVSVNASGATTSGASVSIDNQKGCPEREILLSRLPQTVEH